MTPSTENTGNPRLVPSKRLSHTSLFLMPRAGPVKSEAVPAAFPWAASRRATVRSREYLLHHGILTITGKVECKRCGANFEMGLDLEEKLAELWKFIQREKEAMNCTAPKAWLHPVLPNCPHCGVENCVMPFFGDTKKKAINWLFLLLSQMLGCCTPRQLRYFCKHTNRNYLCANDRILYSTYIGLFEQLLPDSFEYGFDSFCRI